MRVQPHVSATHAFKGLPVLRDDIREAINGGDENAVSKLLAEDATHVLSAADPDGNTALHRAAARGELPIVRALLTAGAHVDASDAKRRTPLHGAVRGSHVETVKALLLKVRRPHRGHGDARAASAAALYSAPHVALDEARGRRSRLEPRGATDG